MKRIKDIFTRVLYEEEPETETEEETEEVLKEEPAPQPKPIPVRPVSEKVIKPEPVTELPQNNAGAFFTLETPKPEQVKVEPVKPEPVKPEPVKQEPVKPVEVKKPEPAVEEKKEPYVTSRVISPMFGYQDKDEKEKPRKKVIKLEEVTKVEPEKKSALGIVFSPLYGDMEKTKKVPADKVDPKVATLSVQDIVAKGKTGTTDEIRVDEVTRAELKKQMSATPFGKLEKRPEDINLRHGWKDAETKEPKQDEQYENYSLFDLEDK